MIKGFQVITFFSLKNQVWFSNKRAKIRRFDKTIEIERPSKRRKQSESSASNNQLLSPLLSPNIAGSPQFVTVPHHHHSQIFHPTTIIPLINHNGQQFALVPQQPLPSHHLPAPVSLAPHTLSIEQLQAVTAMAKRSQSLPSPETESLKITRTTKDTTTSHSTMRPTALQLEKHRQLYQKVTNPVGGTAESTQHVTSPRPGDHPMLVTVNPEESSLSSTATEMLSESLTQSKFISPPLLISNPPSSAPGETTNTETISNDNTSQDATQHAQPQVIYYFMAPSSIPSPNLHHQQRQLTLDIPTPTVTTASSAGMKKTPDYSPVKSKSIGDVASNIVSNSDTVNYTSFRDIVVTERN